MAESPGRRRVLVVDDLPEMRAVIRRALSAHGYDVDVASSLAEVREMNAIGYDAVLVDAHLGAERGVDLIEALMSQDPAAAARCLLITGGATGPLPNGVACMTKPFQLDDLVRAVRALHRPDPARAAGPSADSSRDSGSCAPGAGSAPPRETSSAAGRPQAWQLLGLARQLRAYERHGLTDFLHDGPIQELAALTLELQLMSRLAVPDPDPPPRFDAMLQRLNSASTSLRWLIDGPWPFCQPETQLGPALRQRTAWLLAGPATMDSDRQVAALDPDQVSVVVDVVELMLLGMIPPGQPTRAHVWVRTPEHTIQVELTLTAAAENDELTGDPARVRAWLDELARGLGAETEAALGEGRWRARIVLPDQPERRIPAPARLTIPAQADATEART